jgi:hypothetical protein
MWNSLRIANDGSSANSLSFDARQLTESEKIVLHSALPVFLANSLARNLTTDDGN